MVITNRNYWVDYLPKSFSDIKEGDLLRISRRGGFRYATAMQDTEINEWHRTHKEGQYVNVRYENPAQEYTNTWHPNDTIYGPLHTKHPSEMFERGVERHITYTSIWVHTPEKEETEVTDKYTELQDQIDRAQVAIEKATQELADLKKAEVVEPAWKDEVKKLAYGSVFHVPGYTSYMKFHGAPDTTLHNDSGIRYVAANGFRKPESQEDFFYRYGTLAKPETKLIVEYDARLTR